MIRKLNSMDGDNSSSFIEERQFMLENHLMARGISDPDVLDAFAAVPRENFVPSELADFAYHDTPLPIEEGQTISQPYIVALMTEALGLKSSDRVLEIGTGSGYAAAILSCVASEVFTVERHRQLAETAALRFEELAMDNIHVLSGDGTYGWPEYAPYDAIIVAAGGPEIPKSLVAQLTIGGRLVIPVGPVDRGQQLLRIVREDEHNHRVEDLGGVRFVPLIGDEGWSDKSPAIKPKILMPSRNYRGICKLVKEASTKIDDIASSDLGELLERIGDSRVVLIGEATHGTSEFYQMRSHITKELIEKKGFNFVSIEGDWPDSMQVNRYVTGREPAESKWQPFARFPTWMWRNKEVSSFIEWLKEHNLNRQNLERKVGFYGLDLYSLFCSIDAVISYLEKVDKRAAEIARIRYGCLSPWESDPSSYGYAAITGQYKSCEKDVVSMLSQMLEKRIEYDKPEAEEYFDAAQNSKLVANAERYYRSMYYKGASSWNLRDRHMFDTLLSLLMFYGSDSKAIVWAHNSHVGDSAATEMSARGEFNIGQLCRSEFRDKAFLIGFGTHTGTVAAASEWGAEMEIKKVRPSHNESYEKLCHDSEAEAFFLHLREPLRNEVREELMEPRLARAIGVIYRPETELQSHYYQSILPRQFDEYIWFDETRAVHPYSHPKIHGLPDTFPSGL